MREAHNSPVQVKVFTDSITERGTDEHGEFRVHDIFGVQVRFRRIPEGSFERVDEEDTINIAKESWLMDTAVTQELWTAVMGYNPSNNTDSIHNPVETINWIESQNFICRINAAYPGLNVSLPTSEFWEYAAKGGTVGTRFYTGDTISGTDANFDCSVSSVYNPDPMPAKDKTMPVMSYPPKFIGL